MGFPGYPGNPISWHIPGTQEPRISGFLGYPYVHVCTCFLTLCGVKKTGFPDPVFYPVSGVENRVLFCTYSPFFDPKTRGQKLGVWGTLRYPYTLFGYPNSGTQTGYHVHDFLPTKEVGNPHMWDLATYCGQIHAHIPGHIANGHIPCTGNMAICMCTCTIVCAHVCTHLYIHVHLVVNNFCC